MFKRIFTIVLDGVGIGEAPDADRYGDQGSHTLGNTARVTGGLNLPNLAALGLGNITPIKGVHAAPDPKGSWGVMIERSRGKDTTTGHWEMMGLILDVDFPTFPNGFPPEVLEPFKRATGRGVLCNLPISGTTVLDLHGEEHERTGDLIVYTSMDSVFQIAAHEDVVPLDELYRYCQIARDILQEPYLVTRVIARPFRGKAGAYERANEHRHDYSILPPGKTVMDNLLEAGFMTCGIGKISDIFAKQGVGKSFPSRHNDHGVALTLQAIKENDDPFTFVNLVDFDAKYGHRNNPEGMKQALETFDTQLPELLAAMRPDDLLIITADHGNDPTTPGTDHSREVVPLVIYGPKAKPVSLSHRQSFTDLGVTILDNFGLPHHDRPGRSFLSELT